MIKDNNKCVESRPPIKNPMTATRDGNWRLAKPVMAWPEVQPPAYLVPKPINIPPTISTNKDLTLDNDSIENNSGGTKSPALGAEIPIAFKSLIVAWDKATGTEDCK